MAKRRRRRRRRRRGRPRVSAPVSRASSRNDFLGYGSAKDFINDLGGLTDSKNNMKNKSIEQQKSEFLLKQGWLKVEPEFDFNHLINLGSDTIFKEIGYFASAITEKSGNNPLALFSEEIKDRRDELFAALCPNITTPQKPANTAMISGSWPMEDQGMSSEDAFSELTYRTIQLIVTKVLPSPNVIYQETTENVFRWPLELQDFSFDDLEVLGDLVAVWDNAYLKVSPTTNWNDNGYSVGFEWEFFSNDLRELSSKALVGIGIEINPKSYQLGTIDPEFSLDSFPEYIKEYTEEIKTEMFSDGPLVYPTRFNLLIDGPPGYGKTRWSQAFATEVLSKLGYLVMVIDYSSLEDLVLPNYVDKVCIVVNDADTLCLDRSESQRGETEQMLSWLDGTRSTFIKPFYLDRRSSSITIMTANSVDRWDEAALRKGRIHSRRTFDQIKLSNLT